MRPLPAIRLSALSRLSSLKSHLSYSPSSSASAPPPPPAMKYRVSIIGSGNWGSAIAKIVSENTAANPGLFDESVRMWVYEELVAGQKLTEIINTKHENVKYLPGIALPTNLVAVPDLLDTVAGADILVFNVPHQFLPRLCGQLKGKIPSTVRAISCIKGVELSPDGITIIAKYISDELGIYCGALSGANLAPEVAQEKFSETTIAYKVPDPADTISQKTMKTLFHRPYFHVNVVEDVAGVSLCGALKNIVALASGFVDGMGWGDNAKAAIIRRGLLEMTKFGREFFPECEAATFTEESCGVADVITSCAGGRNHKLGVALITSKRPIFELEEDLLKGQKAQGVTTAQEVHEFLEKRGMAQDFPLFTAVNDIIFNGLDSYALPQILEKVEKPLE
ncbi:NAD-dependent glycerol-3-phosphate dehydrogenase N-terminus-domain-containing protein [Limtongia smithiae]|uniref:NAD-dependent glycerol-3-phosphate dehydrogenase N-terminus-domain-containing protein n=1 Tax=Limtongia smithiae TaxID=1125753 RepID=UPI0034CF2DF9